MKAPVGQFVNLCLAQKGDKYIFASEASATDPNPEAFDCSELIEWASHRLQLTMPDGSMNQRAYCQGSKTMISLAKARTTRGALLFRDISVTGVGHVAVSLGNGTTIEARGSAYGVGIFPFDNRGWTEAALHPSLDYRKRTKPRLDEFWVVFGRYGGRWGRGRDLGDHVVQKAIRDAEAKHGVALVLNRKEPLDISDIEADSYPRWLAKKLKSAA